MAKKNDETQASIIGPNTSFELTFLWSDVKPVYQKVLSKLAKRVKNPGFRPGKVPPKIAEEVIGYSQLVEDTLKELLPQAYQDELAKRELKPITQPEFNPKNIEKEQDWVISVEIAEKPEVSVKGYEKLAKEGRDKGEKELAEHMKEHKKDSAKLSDEEKAHHENHHQEIILKSVFKELILGLKPTMPELLVKEEVRAELEKLVKSLKQIQLTLDDYLARRQLTFENLSTEITTQVLGQLQLEFILEKISEEKKFPIKDEEYQKYFDRIEDPATKKQYQDNPEYRAYLTRVLTREKVIDHLLGK